MLCPLPHPNDPATGWLGDHWLVTLREAGRTPWELRQWVRVLARASEHDWAGQTPCEHTVGHLFLAWWNHQERIESVEIPGR